MSEEEGLIEINHGSEFKEWKTSLYVLSYEEKVVEQSDWNSGHIPRPTDMYRIVHMSTIVNQHKNRSKAVKVVPHLETSSQRERKYQTDQ